MRVSDALEQLKKGTLRELLITDTATPKEIRKLIQSIIEHSDTKLESISLVVSAKCDGSLVTELFNTLKQTNITKAQLHGVSTGVEKAIDLICTANLLKNQLIAYDQQNTSISSNIKQQIQAFLHTISSCINKIELKNSATSQTHDINHLYDYVLNKVLPKSMEQLQSGEALTIDTNDMAQLSFTTQTALACSTTAEQIIQNHQYPRAIQLLQQAISLDHQNYEYYHRIGKAYTMQLQHLDSANLSDPYNPQNIEAIDAYLAALSLSTDNAAIHYSLGATFFRQGANELAIGHLDNALKIDSTHHDALCLLGSIHERNGNIDKAIGVYKGGIMASFLNNTDKKVVAKYWHKLGQIYKTVHNFAEAVKAFQNAIKNNPDDGFFKNDLCIAYKMSNNIEAARKVAREALVLHPNLTGNFQIFLGDDDHASDVLNAIQRVSLRETDSTAALTKTLNAGNTLNSTEIAIQQINRGTITISSTSEVKEDANAETYTNSTPISKVENEYSDAKTTKSIDDHVVVTEDKTAQDYYREGYSAFEQKDYPLAITLFNESIARDPDNAEYYNHLGTAHYQIYQYSEAVLCFERAIHLVPTIHVYHHNIGIAHYNMQEYDQAILHLNNAIRLEPNNMRSHEILGQSYYEIQNYTLTIDHLAKVIKDEPQNIACLKSLAFAYCSTKQHEQAITHFTTVVQIDSQDARSYYNLGVNYMNTGNYKQAAESIKRATEIDSTEDRYHHKLSVVYSCLKQSSLAIESIKIALTIEPNNPEYLNSLGAIYFSMREYDLAIPHLKLAAELNPSRTIYATNYRSACTKAKEKVKKIKKNGDLSKSNTTNATKDKQIEQSKAQTSEESTSTLNISSKTKSKKSKAASASCTSKSVEAHAKSEHISEIKSEETKQESIVELPKKDVGYYFAIAIKKMETNAHAEAIEALKSAINLAPQNPAIHNNLGRNYYELGDQDNMHYYEYAIEEYNQAITINPDQEAYYDNRGSAYYALGQYKEAQDSYKTAIRKNASKAEYYFNYGDALLKDATIPEHLILAYIEYRKALALNQNAEEYAIQAQVAMDQICTLQLRNWDLSNREIGDDEMSYLLHALQNTRGCIALDLRGNNITTRAHDMLSNVIEGTSIINVLLDQSSDIINRVCDANRHTRLTQIKSLFTSEYIAAAYEDMLTDTLFDALLYAPDLIDAITGNICHVSRVLKEIALHKEIIFQIESGKDISSQKTDLLLAIKDHLIAKKLQHNFKEEQKHQIDKDVDSTSTHNPLKMPQASDGDDDEDLEEDLSSASTRIITNHDIVCNHMYNFDLVQNFTHISQPRLILDLIKLASISRADLKAALSSNDTIKKHAFTLCSKLLNIWIKSQDNIHYFDMLFQALSDTLDNAQKIELGYACLKKAQRIEFRDQYLHKGMYKLATIAFSGITDGNAECYSELGKAYSEIGQYDGACRAFNKAIMIHKTTGAEKTSGKGGRKSATPPPEAAPKEKVALNPDVTLATSEDINEISDTLIQDPKVETYIWEEFSSMLYDCRSTTFESSTPIDQPVLPRASNGSKLAECYFYLGNSCRDLGNIPSAAENYLEAQKLDPKNNDYIQAFASLKGKSFRVECATEATTSSESDESCNRTLYSGQSPQHEKKPTSPEQKNSSPILKMSTTWTINGTKYSCDNKYIVQIESLQNCYVAIEESCLDKINTSFLDQFKTALPKLAGKNGNKLLTTKCYELKINGDPRLDLLHN